MHPIQISLRTKTNSKYKISTSTPDLLRPKPTRNPTANLGHNRHRIKPTQHTLHQQHPTDVHQQTDISGLASRGERHRHIAIRNPVKRAQIGKTPKFARAILHIYIYILLYVYSSRLHVIFRMGTTLRLGASERRSAK